MDTLCQQFSKSSLIDADEWDRLLQLLSKLNKHQAEVYELQCQNQYYLKNIDFDISHYEDTSISFREKILNAEKYLILSLQTSLPLYVSNYSYSAYQYIYEVCKQHYSSSGS